MPRLLKFFTLLTMLGCVCLTSCAHDLDRESALRAGLDRLGGRFTTIVLRPAVTPEDRKASKRILPTIEVAELERTPFREGKQVSGRLFFLESIQIDQESAVVSGSVGHIPKPDPNSMFGCGTSFSIKLQKVDDRWQPQDVLELSC